MSCLPSTTIGHIDEGQATQSTVTPSLQWLIHPISTRGFFQSHWEKQTLVVKRDHSNYFASLLSFSAKKQIADTADAKSAQLKKLQADLDKANAQAESAKKSASQVADLQKQNKDLSDQLASAKKEAATKVAAVPPVDTGEAKRLRADLDKAHAQVDSNTVPVQAT